MGASKVGSFIVHYRSRRKEAAEEEKRRRLEDEQRRPAIIDPSFELFGYKTPPTDWLPDAQSSREAKAASGHDDWLFQTRDDTTIPRSYQFDSYCEVTPKSSVSSTNSAASDALQQQPEYDMGWETATTARPRPQLYLPLSASASYSMSMTDLHRGSEYRSRRHSSHIGRHPKQEPLPSYNTAQVTQEQQPTYKVGATLSQPFSIDAPFEALVGPPPEDQCRISDRERCTSASAERLSSIPEHNLPVRNDTMVRCGYRR